MKTEAVSKSIFRSVCVKKAISVMIIHSDSVYMHNKLCLSFILGLQPYSEYDVYMCTGIRIFLHSWSVLVWWSTHKHFHSQCYLSRGLWCCNTLYSVIRFITSFLNHLIKIDTSHLQECLTNSTKMEKQSLLIIIIIIIIVNINLFLIICFYLQKLHWSFLNNIYNNTNNISLPCKINVLIILVCRLAFLYKFE